MCWSPNSSRQQHWEVAWWAVLGHRTAPSQVGRCLLRGGLTSGPGCVAVSCLQHELPFLSPFCQVRKQHNGCPRCGSPILDSRTVAPKKPSSGTNKKPQLFCYSNRKSIKTLATEKQAMLSTRNTFSGESGKVLVRLSVTNPKDTPSSILHSTISV